jgi:hypothetical protein
LQHGRTSSLNRFFDLTLSLFCSVFLSFVSDYLQACSFFCIIYLCSSTDLIDSRAAVDHMADILYFTASCMYSTDAMHELLGARDAV